MCCCQCQVICSSETDLRRSEQLVSVSLDIALFILILGGRGHVVEVWDIKTSSLSRLSEYNSTYPVKSERNISYQAIDIDKTKDKYTNIRSQSAWLSSTTIHWTFSSYGDG